MSDVDGHEEGNICPEGRLPVKPTSRTILIDFVRARMYSLGAQGVEIISQLGCA